MNTSNTINLKKMMNSKTRKLILEVFLDTFSSKMTNISSEQRKLILEVF